MRRSLGLIVVLGVALASGIARADAPATQPSGVTGTWTWTQQGPGGEMEISLKLKQDGDKLTGTISGFQGQETEIKDGKVEDGKISFKVTREFGGNQIVTNYTGTISGDTFKGKSETVFARDIDAKRAK